LHRRDACATEFLLTLRTRENHGQAPPFAPSGAGPGGSPRHSLARRPGQPGDASANPPGLGDGGAGGAGRPGPAGGPAPQGTLGGGQRQPLGPGTPIPQAENPGGPGPGPGTRQGQRPAGAGGSGAGVAGGEADCGLKFAGRVSRAILGA